MKSVSFFLITWLNIGSLACPANTWCPLPYLSPYDIAPITGLKFIVENKLTVLRPCKKDIIIASAHIFTLVYT